MQTKQFLFAFLLFPLALCVGQVAEAQEGQVSGNGEVVVSEKGTTVADVGIYSAAFIEKGNREVTVGFTLRSDLGTQSGVRFGIHAYKKSGATYTLVDTYVTNESLTLPTKEYVYREIGYVPPATVSGELELFVVAKTETNIPLSETPIGTHTFAQASGVPTVTLQGCDVSQISSSTVRCTVRNSGAQQITTILYSELRNYSSFGPLVTSPFSQSVSLRSRESKTIVLDNIPNILSAGVYAIEAKLLVRDNPDILVDRKVFSAQIAGPVTKIANVFVNQASERTFEVGVVSLASLKDGMVHVSFYEGENVCGHTKTTYSRPRTDVVVSTSFGCTPNKLSASLVNSEEKELDKRTIDYTPTLSSNGLSLSADMQTILYGGIGILGLLLAYAIIRRRASKTIVESNTYNQ